MSRGFWSASDRELWKTTAAKRRDERRAKTPQDDEPHMQQKSSCQSSLQWGRDRWATGSRPEVSSVSSAAKKKRKDTKRWCGGKVGREHQTDVRSLPDVKGWSGDYAEDWQLLFCVKCGKELDRYYPSRSWAMPKPAWAK